MLHLPLANWLQQEPVMSDQTRLADFLPYLLSVTSNAVSDRIADEYRARFGLKIPRMAGDGGAG